MLNRTVFASAVATAVAALALVAVQPAAAVPHYVLPGESLWSVATANGIGTATLAAANGLTPDAFLISGTTIQVPVGSAASATTQTAAYVTRRHLVAPGESLSSVAAAHGVSISALAAANGLSPTAYIIIGTTLTIPGATTTSAAYTSTSSTTSKATSVALGTCSSNCTSGHRPIPTSERLTAQQVGDIAQSYGMSRTLVQAIGWQESGFNNAAVSSSNARGVMQLIPPTWDFVNRNLAGGKLNPASAHDNVVAGALYLRYLYRLKGGDRDATIGSYYQGPARKTVLPETQRYISSVLGFKNWYSRHPK
jgi:LysM repeat protein